MTTNQKTLSKDDVPTEDIPDYWAFHPTFDAERHDVPFVLWTDDKDGHIDVWRDDDVWVVVLRIGGGNPVHGTDTTEVARLCPETEDGLKRSFYTLASEYDEAWRTELVNMREVGRSGEIVRIDRQTRFGNPFRLEKDGGDYTREESVRQYRKWFNAQLDDDDEFREAVHSLRGETLGCWCTPKLCHGDVILHYLHGRGIDLELEDEP